MHLALLSSISANNLLSSLGVAGVLLILFAETGLLIGFFLPGDSLLFVAGYATVAHNSLHFHLPLGWLLLAAAAGSIIGSEVGWYLGRATGSRALAGGGGRLFKPEYVERTRLFFERFGPVRAVALARLVPVVRTVMNPLAGVAGMGARSFAIANIASGIVWTAGLILLGHGLGQVSALRKHIDLLAVVVVVLSLIPLLWHLVTNRRRARASTAA